MSEDAPAPLLSSPVDHAESLAKALYLTVKDQQRRIEAAENTKSVLRKGIQAFLDGNYDHPRAYRHEEGMGCKHGRLYYESCDECDSAHFSALLARC